MIYIDTNIAIYLLENVGTYAADVAKILEKYSELGHKPVSSVLLATEFMVGNNQTSIEVIRYVTTGGLWDIDTAVAVRTAELQREHNIKLGDAIHLATAIVKNCDYFMTHDNILAKVAGNYMVVVGLDDKC